MDRSADQTAFVAALTDAQLPLRLYVQSLLPGDFAAADVVQQANTTAWGKREDFEPGTNFKAWAFTAVYYRVLAWRRDRQRDRIELFSEETLEVIARASESCADAGPRAEALQGCMERLPPSDRELLEWKYVERRSLTDLAKRTGSKANNLHQKISRLRQALRICIRKALSEA